MDGNSPAMSKHQLLEHWPQLEINQDITKIVGFAQFYSKFIPQFELCIPPICNLATNFEYTEPITPHAAANTALLPSCRRHCQAATATAKAAAALLCCHCHCPHAAAATELLPLRFHCHQCRAAAKLPLPLPGCQCGRQGCRCAAALLPPPPPLLSCRCAAATLAPPPTCRRAATTLPRCRRCTAVVA